MNITVPIYVEASPSRFSVRPLFFPEPVQQHEKLERAMHLLARDLRKRLRELAKALRHDELAAHAFNPELDHQRLDVAVELRRRVARGRFLFVTLSGLGRRLAFTPSLPDVWFELARGERLEDRAAEVLTRHFREREREDEEDFKPPEELALKKSAWVATLDLSVRAAQKVEPSEDRLRAFLGGGDKPDGEQELHRVGRCIDQLYPDDLDRAVLRDREVAELTRLLTGSDKRPVLLLGPRLVGKTALIHEYVYQRVARRKDPYKYGKNVWLLAPQRLISGMMYVGQWENRLLAILKEARKRQHVLYFDDLLGLYHAGVTCQSDLSAAHVLKPYIERREVRLLAEMTPEAFRVLRERDRGFADLFHLLPVQEPPEDETRRILIASMRQLEGQHLCRFGVEVLPVVLDLQRRYARGAAFPGKAAGFLRRLAVKQRGADVSRDTVFTEFHAQSGLAVSFLDTRAKLHRQEVVDQLRAKVIGQDAALHAAADVIGIARARLNDPERPLASFLFLGPTGVGKTQCAKALAAYLFGDADKILRFDMNEFVASGSAARLVGTFYSPEGLLTSAVRRQPFAVILLDEIEKADPEVFDLLLAVLGEGRLTDALGRTVDFTNTILVLTSNLGVRAAQGSLGFQADGHDPSVYTRAAEQFFRPEFFNRLDRIIPFARLGCDDVSTIARLLIQEVFQREGLLRRKCMLRVEGQALDRVVDQGYDPVLGARALKRAIERQLTRPVAAHLAATVPETLSVISLYPGPNGIVVHVQGLTNVDPQPPPALPHDLRETLRRIDAAVRRIEEQFATFRPTGALSRDELRPEHYRYFAVREQVERLRAQSRDVEGQIEARTSTLRPPRFVAGKAPRVKSHVMTDRVRARRLLHEMAAAQDMRAFVRELAAGAVPTGEKIDDRIAELLRQAALLQTTADCCLREQPEEVLLHVRALDEQGDDGLVSVLAQRYYELFTRHLGLEGSFLFEDGKAVSGGQASLVVKGIQALALTRAEDGTHLCLPPHKNFVPLQVYAWPVAEAGLAAATLAAHRESRRLWLEKLAAGRAAVEDDPFPLQPVVRIYDGQGSTLDLRSGLVAQAATPAAEDLRLFVLAALPLPAELG